MFFPSRLVKALIDDHKTLRLDLLLLGETDISHRERLICFNRFLPNFVSHTRREEKVVYSYMKSVADENLNSLALEGKTKHMIVEKLAEEMLSSSLSEQEWSACAKVLSELIQNHLIEEENDIYPILKDQLDTETDTRLFELYQTHAKTTEEYKEGPSYEKESISDAPTWS